MTATAVQPSFDAALEPGRASQPDARGYAVRNGVRLYWEMQGTHDPTHLLVCPWPIVHSRMWKAQVSYLARHSKTLTFDCKGNGRSDRPRGIEAYRAEEMARDTMAVMDATGTESAVITSISGGARLVLWLLANYPERFDGAVFLGPWLPMTPWNPTEVVRRTFEEPRAAHRLARMVGGTIRSLPKLARSPAYRREFRRFARTVSLPEALAKFNRRYWLDDLRGFVEFNAQTLDLNEPHSTKQIEDLIGWGLTADPVALADSFAALDAANGAIFRESEEIRAACSAIRCPVLVIHGEWDIAAPPEWGRALAKEAGGRYIEIPRTGHLPHARRPVLVNLAMREFADSLNGRMGAS